MSYNDGSSELIDSQELTSAWNQCTNIKYLGFSFCTVDHVKSMMSMRRDNLKALRIFIALEAELEYVWDRVPFDRHAKAITDAFAESTTSVEKIEYSRTPNTGDAFDTHIARNKSSLK